MPMNPREFLSILHVAERLKDTTRHCTTSGRRVESVAEHSWRVALMAYLLPAN
jgi:putative hydrolase of HD superfamily